MTEKLYKVYSPGVNWRLLNLNWMNYRSRFRGLRKKRIGSYVIFLRTRLTRDEALIPINVTGNNKQPDINDV